MIIKMKSKKVGILNYYYSNENFGAVLQCYALQSYICDLGFDSYTIDFRNFPRRPDRALETFIKTYILQNPFEKFRKKWLKLSRRTYFWAFQLKGKFSDYEAFIVGSDQVWRATLGDQVLRFPHAIYFLSFVPQGKKRIAYGVSFGTNKWDVGMNSFYTELVKTEVQKFDHISVRESSGINICNEIFECNAVKVLDPVLLVGRHYFDRIIGSKPQSIKKEIIFYKLDINQTFEDMIDILSFQMKLPSRNIYYASAKKFLNKQFFSFIDVEEWLIKIRDGELIITDSYHCVCFCLLFEKQFIYFPNEKRGMDRLMDLLGLVGLLDRIYVSIDDLKTRHCWQDKIEYGSVNKILQLERAKSNSFLLHALEKNCIL